MAILWESRCNGSRYQVRSAGDTRRLYTNGVLHTQYNPRRPVTGSVWDLLLLPALLTAPGSVQRVLVLGVGGGAVIHLLRHYLRPRCILGIEYSALHLQLGRRFFGLRGRDVGLVCAEAVQWLSAYEGEAFDLIIDDLFMEVEGEPVRAVTASPAWLRLLDSHLSRRGVLVMNFPAPRDFRHSGFFGTGALHRRYQTGLTLQHAGLENCVAAWFKQPVESRELRRRIRDRSDLDAALKRRLLAFRLRNIK